MSLLSERDKAKQRASGRCELCGKRPTRKNPLSVHHIRGKTVGEAEYLMLVHLFVCHPFADSVTQHWLRKGVLLSREMIQRDWKRMGR